MNLSIIVAISDNYAIGKDNDLLWHISSDLKRFKRITKGHTIVMGRNTWLSLPKRPLPFRKNVVITDATIDSSYDGAVVASSIASALEQCKEEKEVFVIGGGSIYHQMIDVVDELYITRVLTTYDADTFFPVIDEDVWRLKDESEVLRDIDSNLQYKYQHYERK